MNKLLILSLCACALVSCKNDNAAANNPSTPSESASTTTTAGGGNQGSHLAKLKIEDVKVGKGNGFPYSKNPVAEGDRVYVVYTGKLADGTMFDSNDEKGKPPFSFVVGEGSVIPGWDQGLVGMVVGGERKLSIPYSLGYGDAGHPPAIPGKSDLFFDIKLLDVTKKGGEVDVWKRDVKIGDGPAVHKDAKVTLKYSVQDVSGAMVDNNGGKPTPVTMGSGQLKEAVEIGMLGPPAMKVGGIREIHIGQQFAMQGRGFAGPQIVTIELLKVG